MNRRLVVVPVLIAAAISLAACSSPTTGTPTGSGGGGGGSTQSDGAPPSTGSSGDAALNALNPCNLLSSAQQDQLQVTSLGPDTSVGGPSCDWQKSVDSNGLNGFTAGVTIYVGHGLDQLNTSGNTVTNDQIGGHQGKQLLSSVQGNCTVSIGVGSSSRVDVTVNAGTDSNQACQVANQVAQAVVPELPAS